MPNFFINVKEKGARKAAGNIGSLTASMKRMALQAVSIAAVVQGLRKSLNMSAEMEGVKRGFDNLAKSSGFSTGAFNKFKTATDGTIDSLTLMKQANNAMLLGITDSEDQMADMFDVAQRLGRALGLDTVQSVESLVTGLGRQSKLMLDNLGIMVDTNKAYADHASSIGKTTAQLTDQERKTAFVNAAMKEANTLVGNLGEEQLTTADKIAQMNTAFGDLAINVGDKLAPVLSKAANFLSTVVEKLAELGMSPLEKMVKSLEEMGADRDLVKSLKVEVANEKLREMNSQLEYSEVQAKIMIAHAKQQMALMQEDMRMRQEEGTLDDEHLAFLNSQFEWQGIAIEDANEQLSLMSQITILEAQILAMKKEESEIEPAETTEVIVKKTQEQLDAEKKLKDDRKDAAKDFVSNFQAMGEAFPQLEKAAKRAGQVQALVDAYASANAAYKAMVGIPVVGPALAVGAAATALGAGLANVKMIEQAATGMNKVVTNPTLILAGEAGAESVNITPLNDSTDAGGGGGALTVNVSGNVLTSDFVENELAETIRESARRGTDFGMN